MSSTTIFHSSFLQLGALQQKPEVVQRGHSKNPYWQYLLFSLSMWRAQEVPCETDVCIPLYPDDMVLKRNAEPELRLDS